MLHRLLVQRTTQPNAHFGEPTEFATPRRLLLSAKVTPIIRPVGPWGKK